MNVPEVRLFVAVKAFIVKEGRVLMLRESSRYADGTNLARYDLPGGRIDPSETLQEALAREVLEETGCAVESAIAFSAGEWWPKKNDQQWHICGIYFAVKLAAGSDIKLSADHDDFIWVDVDSPPAEIIDLWKPVLQQHADFLKSF